MCIFALVDKHSVTVWLLLQWAFPLFRKPSCRCFSAVCSCDMSFLSTIMTTHVLERATCGCMSLSSNSSFFLLLANKIAWCCRLWQLHQFLGALVGCLLCLCNVHRYLEHSFSQRGVCAVGKNCWFRKLDNLLAWFPMRLENRSAPSFHNSAMYAEMDSPSWQVHEWNWKCLSGRWLQVMMVFDSGTDFCINSVLSVDMLGATKLRVNW